MIWLYAAVALIAGLALGVILGRRFGDTPMSALVVSLALVVLVAVGLWQTIASDDRTAGIVVLSAGFGALTGVRLGSEVVTSLLTGVRTPAPPRADDGESDDSSHANDSR